jgi:hypothetical protein
MLLRPTKRNDSELLRRYDHRLLVTVFSFLQSVLLLLVESVLASEEFTRGHMGFLTHHGQKLFP